jgi:hypothetical protein
MAARLHTPKQATPQKALNAFICLEAAHYVIRHVV